MKRKFTKMHGLGNDFVCMNYEDVSKYNFKILSKFICDRHFGVGADGVLIVEESKVSDFKMRIFNNDGTEAEMCGNGIRCMAKYLYEKNFVKIFGILLKADLLLVALPGYYYSSVWHFIVTPG